MKINKKIHDGYIDVITKIAPHVDAETADVIAAHVAVVHELASLKTAEATANGLMNTASVARRKKEIEDELDKEDEKPR